MSTKKINDKDVFQNVIHIGLRMYGNGYSYPMETIDYVTEYCRQQVRLYFQKHNRLVRTSYNNNRISFLSTLVYTSRQKKTCLKRLQQFIHAKDRSTSQQEEIDTIAKDKKTTINDRFFKTCHQLQIRINNNQNEVKLFV